MIRYDNGSCDLYAARDSLSNLSSPYDIFMVRFYLCPRDNNALTGLVVLHLQCTISHGSLIDHLMSQTYDLHCQP